MDQNEFLWRRKYVCGFPGVKRTVHAPLAETFRKFEEWLERSGRHTKRADTTGLVCGGNCLLGRTRAHVFRKQIHTKRLAYIQRSHGMENKHHGPVCYRLFNFSFPGHGLLEHSLTRSVVDLWITNCSEQKKLLYCLY